MLEIKTWRNPYDSGFSPTKPTKILLKPGLTVLVGCNGAGKSTLLANIQDVCEKEKIPCHFYNNLTDGGRNLIEQAIWNGNVEFGADIWNSSEGETIKIGFGEVSKKIKSFLETGCFKSEKNRLAMALRKAEGVPEQKILDKRRVLLFDALDSGLSVDSIVELKEIFGYIEEDSASFGVETYIVVAANEYELARNSECFDVNDGRYLRFEGYEAYRYFILKSREKKEKRIKQQEKWFEKQKEKAAVAKKKREEKYLPMIEKIKQKAEAKNCSLSYSEKYKIQEYERIIKEGNR